MKRLQQQNIILQMAMLFIFLMAGCSNENKSDAYGQFEATETTISAQAAGTLLQFTMNEGDKIAEGKNVGLIDTTQLALKVEENRAQMASVHANIQNINDQIDVQKVNLKLARKNLNRTQAMFNDEAATAKALDEAQTRVGVLKEKIESFHSRQQSLRANLKAIKRRIDQLNEQIEDAKIINPVQGTVLTTFVEQYEVVRKGQPLYRIADLDTLILQVYVSGAQLPHVKLGEEVQVLVDKNAEEYRSITGTVSWIANKAEFTPSAIQTKEERVTQVYAVEVRVPNPKGILKIGMPGEVNFSRGSAQMDPD